MIDLAHQPCPVCGTTASSLLHQTTYPEYGYAGAFAMRRCDRCGLLFNSPRLDDNKLKELYGKNYYFFSRAASSEFRRIPPMYFRTVGRIDESQFQTKRSMDIGCGRGYFPAVLKNLGWNAHGIEISPAASERARRDFSLDVFTGTVEQYAAKNKKRFPVVTAIDVIEHVSLPDEFIRAAAELVGSNGWLIIDTPNAAAANMADEGIFWKGFNPFHIFLFSIKNLTTLLSRRGFTVEQSFSYHNAPTSGWRRKIIGGLKKSGLLPIATQMYFISKRWPAVFDRSLSVNAKKTAEAIKLNSPIQNHPERRPFRRDKNR
jgi:2-polyprenyl-3-methyl-5-hydroxy-6-metoxy-1,4-benzoquinol methylase